MGIIERGSGEVTRHETSMQAGQVLGQLAHTFSNGNIALLLIVLAMAVGYKWRRSGFVWGWLIVVLLAIVVVNAAIPFMVHARYMLVLWPTLALLVALGIERMATQHYLAPIVLTLWLLINFDRRQKNVEIDPVIQRINKTQGPFVKDPSDELIGITLDDLNNITLQAAAPILAADSNLSNISMEDLVHLPL